MPPLASLLVPTAMAAPAATIMQDGSMSNLDEPLHPSINTIADLQSHEPQMDFQWTPMVVSKVALLFLLAGLAEIGGGWLVWQAAREGKPWWWAILGSVVLVGYGVIPTFQPLSDFGRLYAVYGGIFIGLSYGWGVLVDDMRVDKGDVIGSALALAGICVALFWPRSG